MAAVYQPINSQCIKIQPSYCVSNLQGNLSLNTDKLTFMKDVNFHCTKG